MRCSLLTLSTYVDGELAPDRAGELEAHLVACQRCSDGLHYLREEQQHIRGLAPVTTGAGSANELLATVGIAIAPPPPQVQEPDPAPQFLLDLAESPKPTPAAERNGADEHDSFLELNGSSAVPKQPAEAAAAPDVVDDVVALPPAETVRFESEHFETKPLAEPSDVAPAQPDAETVETMPLEPEIVETVQPEPAFPEAAEATDTEATAFDEEPIAAAAADPDADAVDAWLAAGQDVVIPDNVPPAPPQWSGDFAASMAPTMPPPIEDEPAAPEEQRVADAVAIPEMTPSAAEETLPSEIPETPPAAIEEMPPSALEPTPPAAPPDPLPPIAPREELPGPPQPAAPPVPPPVGPKQGGRGASWFDRARDAVALRFALMKGSRPEEDLEEEGIQIVSGAGAPARPELRQHRPATEAPMPLTGTEQPDSIPPPMPFRDFDLPGDATSAAQPTDSVRSRDAFELRDGFEAPLTFETSMPETPGHVESVETAPPMRPQSAAEAPSDAHELGRHTRALHGERRSLKLPGFTMPKRRPVSKRPAPAGPLYDRRLWIFASAVVVLAIIGVLIGKSTTLPAHPANGSVPNPTAIALPSAPALSSPAPSAATTPQATPQATPQSTPAATPAPTPSAPNPNNLTGAQTLGAGGSGFTVQDVRYGEHPNDFRIVFDLSGSGSPTTTVGFGNPTTLYVVLDGTTGSGQPAQPPAGQTATAVKLLQPSPIAGKTVYEITLSGAAKLSTSYLQGPVRLVIDLS